MAKAPITNGYTLADAIAIVFGAPPFNREYTTKHITAVLAQLLGQPLTEDTVLEALRAAEFATPRPGASLRQPLKWRFSRAPGVGTGPRKKRRPLGPEKSLIDSQRLKL